MSNDLYRLIAFIACLVTIGLLSKIGGTGADLAIMTGIVALAGALITSGGGRDKVTVDNEESDPIPVKGDTDGKL